MTAQPPATTPKAQLIWKIKSLHKKVIQRATPTTPKHSNSCLHPMAWSRKDVREPLRVEERLASSSYSYCYYYIKTSHKIELQTQEQVIPSATVAPKLEKCGWGLNCPIYKNLEENWDGNHQKQFQQNGISAQPQQPQMQSPQHSQTKNYQMSQNFQCSWSQTFDVPDRYSNQSKLCWEWEEGMERLKDKYGLNCFSDSESDVGEEYRYEHKYETLI